MKFRALSPMVRLSSAIVMLFLGISASAQTTTDGVTSFGNHLSMATIASTLQAGGYQALISNPTVPGANVIGAITTGMNGMKIVILMSRCDNSKDDEVCLLSFFVTFNDEKNLITEMSPLALMQKTNLSKVMMLKRPDGKAAFTFAYAYPCKGLDDPKFVPMVLVNFANDVSRGVAFYNAGMVDHPAPSPAPAPSAKP